MKNFIFYRPCLLFLIFLFGSSLSAQWEPEMRLTFDPAQSSNPYNNARCIAAINDTVHVVWYDYRDGNSEIYYKRSIDAGVSWIADMRLTDNPSYSIAPAIAVSGTNIHLVWREGRDANDEIYYKRSTNGGTNWGIDTRLTNNPNNSWYPSIAVSGMNVHCVWYDNRDGNWEIYYKRSIDGGTNWGIDTRLTNNPNNSQSPSIAVSGTDVHCVWWDNRDGNAEIYYKRSIDGGTNWQGDTRLTSEPSTSDQPCITVSGMNVHIVWDDLRGGGNNLYYKRSLDGGTTWGTDTQLATNSFYPSVTVSGTYVHVARYSPAGPPIDIYYRRSLDNGTSWEPEIPLTSDPNSSVFPSIAVSGSMVHVVWEDNRDGNWEIYYKRNPTGNLKMEETRVNIPEIGYGLEVYPNPFSENLTIKFQVPNPKHQINLKSKIPKFNLKIYDASGRLVRQWDYQTMRQCDEIVWHGDDDFSYRLPVGVYFVRLEISGHKLTKKVILLK